MAHVANFFQRIIEEKLATFVGAKEGKIGSNLRKKERETKKYRERRERTRAYGKIGLAGYNSKRELWSADTNDQFAYFLLIRNKFVCQLN